MVSGAAESSFGWLDFDANASERVGTLLRALEEPGTLDPLGLGPVRDAFSNMLAPGTSTIQTRLRYFVFLPWIFQRLERDTVPPSQFRARLRDDEARLIDCLRHLGPNHGVQGFTAGRALQRMPSEAYWGGLRSWGLRRLDLSIAEYGRHFAAFGRQKAEHDDDGNAIESTTRMWSHVPDAPDRFLADDVSFDLTLDEATFLIDQLRRQHPRSLLAAAVVDPAVAARVDFPWEVPAELLKSDLVELLHHARCVSELTEGPQHLYNLLVAQRAEEELGWDTSELQSRIESWLTEWVAKVAERGPELADWSSNLEDFWAVADPFNQMPETMKDFVGFMVIRAAEDPEDFVDDQAVRRRIRDREVRLKTNRARLGPRTALENWNQQPLGRQLTYRWEICQTYLEDLGAALGAQV